MSLPFVTKCLAIICLISFSAMATAQAQIVVRANPAEAVGDSSSPRQLNPAARVAWTDQAAVGELAAEPIATIPARHDILHALPDNYYSDWVTPTHHPNFFRTFHSRPLVLSSATQPSQGVAQDCGGCGGCKSCRNIWAGLCREGDCCGEFGVSAYDWIRNRTRRR